MPLLTAESTATSFVFLTPELPPGRDAAKQLSDPDSFLSSSFFTIEVSYLAKFPMVAGSAFLSGCFFTSKATDVAFLALFTDVLFMVPKCTFYS